MFLLSNTNAKKHIMIILVAGATGATGTSLVKQLLDRGHKVRVIARSPQKFSADISNNSNLTMIKAPILDLSDKELEELVQNCDAVVSCLGHTLNFKGMFGHPRKLCTEATRRLCSAIERNNFREPIKFVLMNSVGVKNPDFDRKRSLFDRTILSLLHYILPPHRDNETAAEYLRKNIGENNNQIEWCCVRPDTLINADISSYDITPSPVTGIFTGHPTSRANVAHFMVALIESATLWSEWKSRMPVIMNN